MKGSSEVCMQMLIRRKNWKQTPTHRLHVRLNDSEFGIANSEYIARELSSLSVWHWLTWTGKTGTSKISRAYSYSSLIPSSFFNTAVVHLHWFLPVELIDDVVPLVFFDHFPKKDQASTTCWSNKVLITSCHAQACLLLVHLCLHSSYFTVSYIA